MSKNNSTVSEKVTIDLGNFLMPISVFLSFLILSSFLLIGMNNIAFSLRGEGTKTTTTTTTDTGTTNNTDTGQTSAVSIDKIKEIFNGDYIKFGDANRPLLFVEFSDPSCPFCQIASGKNGELNKQAGERFILTADGGTYVAPVVEMKKLVDSGKASYAWIYTNGHGAGVLATKALYCANEQGKFWNVHDIFMSSQGYNVINEVVKNDVNKIDDLLALVSGVVDTNAIKSCVQSGKYDSKITQNEQLAVALGARGTPNFFVNTTNFAGAYSFSDMLTAVNSALGQ